MASLFAARRGAGRTPWRSPPRRGISPTPSSTAASTRLARRLAAAGVGPEVRVALLAQRSPALIVGLLGILKAGGAYVPLDPSYPAERLAWMLADSGARVLLGQPELLAELPEETGLPVIPVVELTAEAGLEAPEAGPEPRGPLPDGLAYVMYTSGSTGRPKGVGVTHRNIVRLVRESGFADLGAGSGLPAARADLLRRLDARDLGAARERRAGSPSSRRAGRRSRSWGRRSRASASPRSG